MTGDLTKMKYSPAVMEQACTRCGAPKFRRCKSPRGDDAHAHHDRLIAAGYVQNKKTKEWDHAGRVGGHLGGK